MVQELHWSLMAFSVKYRTIMYCDSIYCATPATKHTKDVAYLLSSYMFPHIPRDDWKFNEISKAERFQKVRQLDCGFHIMNFMLSAIKDTRIDYRIKEFDLFKTDMAARFNVLQR
jgi:Ulp1 family protease